MKKLIFIIALCGIFATVSAQTGKISMFKPVPKNLFVLKADALKAPKIASVWVPRFSAGMMATQWTLESGKIVQQSFNKIGLAISYSHFIETEVTPYNNFSVNGFVFFPVDGTTSKLTLAITVSALQYLQIGIDYDFGLKKPGLLTGISYTF